jgi:hypothetical protein
MAKSKKPKVPRTRHRSAGDTGVPQRGHDLGDNPRQAVESGEQDVTDRSRGRVIDESGKPAGTARTKPRRVSGKGEHWESGRHKSQ